MSYHVYENWQAEGHKARIHYSECSFCHDGKGIHPGASDDHGCWHGPFATMRDALDAAHATGGRVTMCKKCDPV